MRIIKTSGKLLTASWTGIKTIMILVWMYHWIVIKIMRRTAAISWWLLLYVLHYTNSPTSETSGKSILSAMEHVQLSIFLVDIEQQTLRKIRHMKHFLMSANNIYILTIICTLCINEFFPHTSETSKWKILKNTSVIYNWY